MASHGPFGVIQQVGRWGSARFGPLVGPRVAALVLVAAPVAVVACTGGDVPAAPADDAELVEGQAIYTANCAQCHGPSGGGALGLQLNNGKLLERIPDPADQKALLLAGKGQMPGFEGKLSDAELDAVIRYTREVIAEQ